MAYEESINGQLDRHGKLTNRGVTITAPKVKIVACKSGDATDGKKANKG